MVATRLEVSQPNVPPPRPPGGGRLPALLVGLLVGALPTGGILGYLLHGELRSRDAEGAFYERRLEGAADSLSSTRSRVKQLADDLALTRSELQRRTEREADLQSRLEIAETRLAAAEAERDAARAVRATADGGTILDEESYALDPAEKIRRIAAGEIGPDDFEHVAFILTRIGFPELRPLEVTGRLDELAAALAPRLEGKAEGREKLEAIAAFLREAGFEGHGNQVLPENTYPGTAITGRVGNPLALCAVWILLGHRVGIEIEGLGLPGFFMNRWQGEGGPLIIDGYGMRIITPEECAPSYARFGLTAEKIRDFPAASPRDMLARMASNAVNAHRAKGEAAQVGRLAMALQALSAPPATTVTPPR